MKTVLILGANGRFGQAATQAFAGAGWRVLAQVRRAGAAALRDAARALLLPLQDTAGLARQAAGAQLVLYAINPPYTRWDTQALPLLRQGNRPIIANISSVLGHRAVAYKSEYCASKFALHGFSDALRCELAGDGIDVLIVSPSTTSSEFFDRVLDKAENTNDRMPRAMSPQVVPQKTVRAMRRGKHEVILSAGGKALVWLDRLCPAMMDRMLARFG